MKREHKLYDILHERINKRCYNGDIETGIDSQRLCKTINFLSHVTSHDEYIEHYKEIYLLILHHEIVTNGVLFSEAAHNGNIMKGGKGITYAFSDLPPLLQKIIAEYVENPNYD